MLSVSFNQDYSCFACGFSNGFRIYNCDPFKETFRRVDFNGGIGICTMLFRCNLLALVGGGRNPKFPPNIVKIWDDHQNRAIGELMFRSAVKAVLLRRDRVVVVLEQKVYVYRFSDLKLLDQISTIANRRGLCALCPDSSSVVLACPGHKSGTVRVELYDLRKSHIVPAHESDLAAIALNQQGTRLVTASEKGTLLRLFDTHTGELLREFRRGTERATINCVVFSKTTEHLACSSDKGTVHIFNLGSASGKAKEEENGGSSSQKNNTSKLALLRRVLPGVPKYVESEWSFAQVHGLDPQSICAFIGQSETIAIVGADGSYTTSNFSAGGECDTRVFSRFASSVAPQLPYPSTTPATQGSDASSSPQPQGGNDSGPSPEPEFFHSVVNTASSTESPSTAP